jgi:uncharacterized Zn-binding protein involved in type VI secretion
MSKPAARLGDMTMHGGCITMGFPMVLIGGMPAARLGDMHVCPMVNPAVPPIPHVGGPVLLGSTGVLIGGAPAARMGDMLLCVGPPDSIVMGCMNVLIGEMGSGGASGGGAGMSGAAAAAAGAKTACTDNLESVTKEEHWTEFAFVDKAGNPVSGVHYKFMDSENKESHGMLRPDGRIRRDGIKEGECKVILMDLFGAEWSQEQANVGDTVKLSVKSTGIDDGEKVEFRIFVKDSNYSDRLLTELDSSINNNKADIEWELKIDNKLIKIIDHKETIGRYSQPFFYFDAYCNNMNAKSGLLYYEDFIEVSLKDEDGKSLDNIECKVFMPSGEIKNGKLDGNGKTKIDKLPAGKVKLSFNA